VWSQFIEVQAAGAPAAAHIQAWGADAATCRTSANCYLICRRTSHHMHAGCLQWWGTSAAAATARPAFIDAHSKPGHLTNARSSSAAAAAAAVADAQRVCL